MLDFLNSGFLVLVCLVRWIGGALAVMTAAGRRAATARDTGYLLASSSAQYWPHVF
jgi:hypothetical protein